MAKDDETIVPGLTLDSKLAAKLDSLDDHLEPIKPNVEEAHDDKGAKTGEADATAEAEGAETSEEDESAADGKDGADDKDTESGDSTDNDGYTIDEGDEETEEDTAVSTNPEDASKPDTRQLSPEQKYILDNLEPLTVHGYVGDSDELKEFKVYAPEYLPAGFKFVDEREMTIASRAFGQLEAQAQKLQNDYRGQETQKAAQEFKEREDKADRQDIATLQRDGKIPLFKARPDSAGFENDPGVKLVQEVIDFKEKQNAKYMEEYNAGRPYKHIGFDEAFRMYQRDNPTKGNPAQTKEDKERQDMARRTSKTNGSSTKEAVQKARVHSGMSSMDLESLIESKTAAW